MVAVRASAGAFDLLKSRGGPHPSRDGFWNCTSAGLVRDLQRRRFEAQTGLARWVKTVTIQKNWQELIRPNKLQVTPGSDATRFATLVAEPLERGFGQTLGNALRRILLSSLQGAAVQSVHIDGVLHEFSSIAGVREDVTDIVLNIKDIAIKMQGEGPKRMVVQEAGPGRSHGRRHPDRRRHRRAQSGPADLHAGRGRRDPHGVHGRHRQGLRPRRAQPPRGRADRPDPGRQPVLAGPQGLLQGREHPRGPDPRLRQADHDDRDQRRGHAGRLRWPMPRASCRTSSTSSSTSKSRARKSRRRSSPISPSTRRSSRRSTSSSCRCVRPTA